MTVQIISMKSAFVKHLIQNITWFFIKYNFFVYHVLTISVLAITTTIKPMGANMWRYVKVEMAPPLTSNFFNGPGGRALENMVSGLVNKVIEFCETNIKAQEDEKRRLIREKQEAIKKAEEKKRLEAEAIAKEKKIKAEEKAKAEAAKAKAEAEAAKAKSEAETAAKAKDKKTEEKKKIELGKKK